MKVIHIRALTAVVAFAAAAAIGQQNGASARALPEVFSATASIDSPKGQASVPVEIKIDRFTTDTERDATELGALLQRKLAHVNLIPFNPVEDTPYRAPDRTSIRRFKEMVEAKGINVTVRDTRGREADAACGQLHERVMRSRQAVEV